MDESKSVFLLVSGEKDFRIHGAFSTHKEAHTASAFLTHCVDVRRPKVEIIELPLDSGDLSGYFRRFVGVD